ncbi:MAG: STING domain-containing protein [Saprospiraceae bacterium]
MELKPTLFIGSSTEGLPVAELVKKHLSDFADCSIWNEEDVFGYGRSIFETLMELLSFFEYGVMVGTADDYVEVPSRGEKHIEARDNVIFELGLFYGRLGREKVFFLKEKGAKTPSDLLGIALPDFSSKDAADLEEQIKLRCERIKKQIADRSGIFDGGIFPSIPLAYGYFHNSILPICRQLAQSPIVKVKGQEREIETFSIKVLIPDDLRNDMKEKVEAVKMRDKWVQVEVPTSATRSFNFYVQESKDMQHLVIMDIPTTLNALNQTIQEFVGSGKVGRNLKEQLVEQREIRHFQKVVDYLSSVNAFTKGKIITEIVNI